MVMGDLEMGWEICLQYIVSNFQRTDKNYCLKAMYLLEAPRIVSLIKDPKERHKLWDRGFLW